MSKKIEQMSPRQIRERGRELLRLAQHKETEIKNRQLVEIGKIFQREIQGGWVTPWPVLQKELEDLVGVPVGLPAWILEAGVQGGLSAPLVEVKE